MRYPNASFIPVLDTVTIFWPFCGSTTNISIRMIKVSIELIHGQNGVIEKSEKPYGCGKCEKKFSAIIELENHVKTHSVNAPAKCYKWCRDCGLKVPEESLENHEMTHTGGIPKQSKKNKPFSCPKCGKTFVALLDLKCHERSHQSNSNNSSLTGGQNVSFSCKTCNQNFSDRFSHQQHTCPKTNRSKERTGVVPQEDEFSEVNNEKPFNCQQCDKRLPNQNEFKMPSHVRLSLTCSDQMIDFALPVFKRLLKKE